MSYTSYFKKSLKILSMINDKGVFVLDKDSLYDPEEIEMMLDVLHKLEFIVKDDKGFIISEKGKNVLNYFKDELKSENKPILKPIVK
jgi:hypothetical protein